MKFFWQRDRDVREERHSAFSGSSFGASSMALLMVAPTAPAGAAGSQAGMTVSATVLKHVSLKVLSQPSAVVVTAQDVERGYVDVAAPAQVAVKSNSTRGYMLEFANGGDFMRQIVVTGLSSDVQLSPAGGAIAQPAAGTGVTRATFQLGFRFLLAASTRPGTYAWPLHLSASPI
ncbi:hypothetical protein [Ramlibacter sp.]|uniref:hypothetical protein n=1 Tax=Ramlibacter sp. TaxID=1917967 RepID=UPI002D0B36A2|nr:hypothetical protein [Ramlibacter sp.]HWI82597.1 hypothetical protein [Ramlibacter sp.]